MAKKKKKQSKTDSKQDKKVVTIKIPSIKMDKIKLNHILIGGLIVLLAISAFFNFRGGFGKGNNNSTGSPEKLALTGLVYLCPPGNCETNTVGEWSNDLDFELTPYQATWVMSPVGLLFTDESVEIIDVSTEDNFYKTVCDSTQNERACKVSAKAEEEQAAKMCENMEKVDKPELEAFVVSYCPFGLQMQRMLVPVNDLIGDIADIKVRYMGSIVDGKVTAMHGDREAQENLKQICIREEQSEKFWDYLSCFMKADGRSEACSEEVGIDTDILEECMTGDKGLEYAQEDFTLQAQYGVTGSPSLFLNGQKVSEFDFGGRTAEAVKSMVCCSVSGDPEECETELSTEQANTAFAEQYSSGSSTGTGSC
jgi:hypothetical protein